MVIIGRILFFALEQERIWRRSWLMVGHRDELPERGSYFLWDVAGMPIFLVRDRDDLVAAPAKTDVPTEILLSEAYAAEQRAKICDARAMSDVPGPSLSPSSDTVYLTVVDADGNAISFINSLFSVFGTGIVSDNSGVLIHNRGSSFVTETDPVS